MLPILYLAFARGARQGTAAGLVTGILKLVFGGYVVHPIQAVLDYPLGSAVVGLAPIFAVGRGTLRVITGTLGGFLLQLGCYVASGVVFFAEYAPEGVSPWIHSITYNAWFVVPELIISAVVVAYLMSRTAAGSGVAHRRSSAKSRKGR
ncbi:MAG: Thiamine transporter ThiT [Firmicutes bacterium ADurb.Bin506]|nr:MAG: Thiamine transporter ThiT [Firmicutes bacterium ADurb.Bin506]